MTTTRGLDARDGDTRDGDALARDDVHVSVARHNPNRWRLSRAGFVDVWQYYDVTMDLSTGRGILRGPNGSGKSRALEMLLPFLLDADRRHMGTGVPVKLEDLMERGIGERTTRQGYLWLELARTTPEGIGEHYTLGAAVRYSHSSRAVTVSYFTTALRVGHDLLLMDSARNPLSRADLLAAVGSDRVTDNASQHRERVRSDVFGLTGDTGRERFDGLLALLHTLRHPDVGNQIENGALPAILSAALPPLSENALEDAGTALDNLTSTREDLERLRVAREHVTTFLDTYRRWLTATFEATYGSVRARAAAAIDTRTQAEKLTGHATRLDTDRAHAQTKQATHTQAAAEADTRIGALRASPAYQAVGQLDDKRRTVAALKGTATVALDASAKARTWEQDATEAADAEADTVTTVTTQVSTDLGVAHATLRDAGLTGHDLPLAVTVTLDPAPTHTEPVHTTLTGELSVVSRPAPVTLTTDQASVAATRHAATATATAAHGRATFAAARLAEARRLASDQQQIAAARTAAGELANQADTDDDTATDAAEQRDSAGRALTGKWDEWTHDDNTVDLLGPIDWPAHPLLGRLLADPDLLTGPPVDPDLDGLDQVANEAAESARDRLRTDLSVLDTAETAAATREAELGQERAQLEAQIDPAPAGPPWQLPHGTPLWRVTEFSGHLDPTTCAGLEAALAGSGLLTAAVDPAGRALTETGHLLISAAGPAVDTPLSAVIRPDAAGCAAAGLDAAVVADLLARISFAAAGNVSAAPAGTDGTGGAVVIGADGSWRHGPLRGRHSASTAQHIGAAARAAARDARLRAIAAELGDIANTRTIREVERVRLGERQTAISDCIRRAPTTTDLIAARARAETLKQTATLSRDRADAAARAVDDRARRWQQANRDHHALCAEADLPVEASELESTKSACGGAAAACRAIPASLDRLEAALERWQAAALACAPKTLTRAEAEQTADQAWSSWDTARAEYDTLEAAVGQDVRRVQQDLATAEDDHQQHCSVAQSWAAKVLALTGEHAQVAQQAATALTTADAAAATLRETVAGTVRKLALPGVIDTLYTDSGKAAAARDAFAGPAATVPAAAASAADQLSTALRRARTNDAALMSAFAEFGAAVGEMYDVAVDNSDGIHLYELIDADGRRPLATAAADLAVKFETGRNALTEEEHRVFTEFVLGEVGEEMRRRILQATSLIDSMNRSLSTISTSHGVTVKVKWSLDGDAAGDVVAIDQLVRKVQAARNPDQDEELIELLRTRVQAAADADPASGFVDHLRSALDYRDWHRIEVLVSAPHLGEQRVSRRSKLSQGETRTVSYMTLFAAVDAYLSGVSDERALRVILLDDAFAKVDQQAVEQLMGLLVRLDIDFVMTGFDLWGCYASVPALDVYTVLRIEGGPAVVQHTHWDGHTRHLRVS